ncbi:hypothetical protein G7Y89_g7633 [Cudoniella acicularis]|uniref:Serine protease n=1 Tax=Cudoniella acicularis TaxID=354080 RepID=A0A8H4W1S4_9HELO|nr:hypothetical protein G7Y89_g7633 [Cudoniella acicularis]
MLRMYHTCPSCVKSTAPIAWKLDQCEAKFSSNSTPLHDLDSDSEAVLGRQHRNPASKRSLEPGGKYRAICKLFVTFDGASKEATGWCFTESGIIATAGHCVYDEEYGRALAIEAHISYHGADSDLRKTHEVRMAVNVAVHRGWYDGFLKHNDIAIITLRTPFDEATPLKWGNCPVRGEKVTLRVVGYPLDIPGGREGQYMYESTGPTDWDLEQNDMLIHRLDTFLGSPVFHLREDQELVVIGVHVGTGKIPRPTTDGLGSGRTGKLYRVNKAVAIGHMSNNFDILRQAIECFVLQQTSQAAVSIAL